VDRPPRRSPDAGRVTATRETAAPRSAATVRDPFFDNAKFLLIVLVVLGYNRFPVIHDAPLAKAASVLAVVPALVLATPVVRRATGWAVEPRRLLAA
jgi:hypothetical protein